MAKGGACRCCPMRFVALCVLIALNAGAWFMYIWATLQVDAQQDNRSVMSAMTSGMPPVATPVKCTTSSEQSTSARGTVSNAHQAKDISSLPTPAWRVRHCGEAAAGDAKPKQNQDQVYMIFVQGSGFILGAVATAVSIRATGTWRPLVCVHIDLEQRALDRLVEVCDSVEPLDKFPPLPNGSLSKTSDAPKDLWATFNELELWRLTKFRRVLKIDADIVVLQNVDELFDLPGGSVAAALDPLMWWGPLKENPQSNKKYLNTGFMLFEPNLQVYEDFRKALELEKVPMFAGEQLLIAKYFEDHFYALPRVYNVDACCHPVWSQFVDRIKVVHFMRVTKPWVYHKTGNTPSGTGAVHIDLGAYDKFYNMWMKYGSLLELDGERVGQVKWKQLCDVQPVPPDKIVVPPPRAMSNPRSVLFTRSGGAARPGRKPLPKQQDADVSGAGLFGNQSWPLKTAAADVGSQDAGALSGTGTGKPGLPVWALSKEGKGKGKSKGMGKKGKGVGKGQSKASPFDKPRDDGDDDDDRDGDDHHHHDREGQDAGPVGSVTTSGRRRAFP